MTLDRYTPARWLLVLCALLVLGACSSIRVAYNNADLLARFRVSDYVDFTPAQAEQFRQRFASLHRWHRMQELPAYPELLRGAGERIARGLSREDVAWALGHARTEYRKVLAKAAVDAAPLMASLAPEQLDKLEKRLADNNRRYARENLEGDAARLRQKRFNALEEYFQDWIGSLTEPQQQLIERFTDEHARMQAARLQDRRRTQQALLAVLRSERDAQALSSKLLALVTQADQMRTAEYRAAMSRYEAALTAMLLDVDRSLTADQRQRAHRRAMRYADDFAALSSPAPTAQR